MKKIDHLLVFGLSCLLLGFAGCSELHKAQHLAAEGRLADARGHLKACWEETVIPKGISNAPLVKIVAMVDVAERTDDKDLLVSMAELWLQENSRHLLRSENTTNFGKRLDEALATQNLGTNYAQLREKRAAALETNEFSRMIDLAKVDQDKNLLLLLSKTWLAKDAAHLLQSQRAADLGKRLDDALNSLGLHENYEKLRREQMATLAPDAVYHLMEVAVQEKDRALVEELFAQCLPTLKNNWETSLKVRGINHVPETQIFTLIAVAATARDKDLLLSMWDNWLQEDMNHLLRAQSETGVGKRLADALIAQSLQADSTGLKRKRMTRLHASDFFRIVDLAKAADDRDALFLAGEEDLLLTISASWLDENATHLLQSQRETVIGKRVQETLTTQSLRDGYALLANLRMSRLLPSDEWQLIETAGKERDKKFLEEFYTQYLPPSRALILRDHDMIEIVNRLLAAFVLTGMTNQISDLESRASLQLKNDLQRGNDDYRDLNAYNFLAAIACQGNRICVDGLRTLQQRVESRLKQADESMRTESDNLSTYRTRLANLRSKREETIDQLSSPNCYKWINVRCESCYGHGQINCQMCGGAGNCGKCEYGKISCGNCYGSGDVQCYTCYGVGTTSGVWITRRPDGTFDRKPYVKTCDTCQGRRFIPCNCCNNHGKVYCPKCGGTGKCQGGCGGTGSVNCFSCKGTGEISQRVRSAFGKQLDEQLKDIDYNTSQVKNQIECAERNRNDYQSTKSFYESARQAIMSGLGDKTK